MHIHGIHDTHGHCQATLKDSGWMVQQVNGCHGELFMLRAGCFELTVVLVLYCV